MPSIGIGNRIGRSLQTYCTPRNVVITSITGGNRITFTQQCPLTSTELYANIDGAGYNLLATLAPGTTTYDHTGLAGNIVAYKLRAKNAGLQAPLNLDSSLNTGFGVTLTWDDNNTDATHIEIWASTDGGAYALIDTIAVGTETYNDTVSDAEMIYKVRAKLAPDYSAYSNTTSESVPSWESEGEVVIKAGNTVGWYDPTDANMITASSGLESIYWDKIYGKEGALGAEQNSGVIVLQAVYKITATQANFFYAGCTVGDVFICRAVKTCDANNKVQRFTGNHLTAWADTHRPTNHIFDGVDNYLKTAPFTWVRPEFIYMVCKQITWTLNDTLFDGFVSTSGKCQQNTASPQFRVNNGVSSPNNTTFAVNTLSILRISLAVGSGNVQVNNSASTAGPTGTAEMGGFTLGSQGAGDNLYSNIDVREIVLRNITDTAGDQTKIYNYLATKHGLPTI